MSVQNDAPLPGTTPARLDPTLVRVGSGGYFGQLR
jgi:hypothetical protein